MNSSLTEIIKIKRRTVKTSSLPVSIGEFVSMYEDDSIDIQPKFQRFFRWSQEDKTSFIESILIGMPIPPLFVAEDDQARWVVIDGLQRLSTILEFYGKLKDKDDILKPLLVLKSPEQIPELEGKTFESFDSSLKFIFRTFRLDFNRLTEGTDPQVRYELFKIINTKGSVLSRQEVRNSLIIQQSDSLYDELEKISTENFKELVNLSEDKKEKRYDIELIIRAIYFLSKQDNIPLSRANIKSFSDELDNFVPSLSELYENKNVFQKIVSIFTLTTDLLVNLDKQSVLKKWNKDKEAFTGQVTIAAYEIIFVSLSLLLFQQTDLSFIKNDEFQKELLVTIKGLSLDSTRDSYSIDRINTNLGKGKKTFEELISRYTG